MVVGLPSIFVHVNLLQIHEADNEIRQELVDRLKGCFPNASREDRLTFGVGKRVEWECVLLR